MVYRAFRITATMSRVSFNNCGLYTRPQTIDHSHPFWATHGGMGGVPGERELDDHGEYVSEGVSELALMSATYDVAGIHWAQRPGDHWTQDDLLRSRRAIGNRTQVTFEEDAVGARRVWLWAQDGLREMGFW